MSIQVFRGDGAAPPKPVDPKTLLWPKNHFKDEGLHVIAGTAASGKTALMLRQVVDLLEHTPYKVIIVDGWNDNGMSDRLNRAIEAAFGRRAQQSHQRVSIMSTKADKLQDIVRGRSDVALVVDGLEGLTSSDGNRHVAMKKAAQNLRGIAVQQKAPIILTLNTNKGLFDPEKFEIPKGPTMVADTVTMIQKTVNDRAKLTLMKSRQENPGAEFVVDITTDGYVQWL